MSVRKLISTSLLALLVTVSGCYDSIVATGKLGAELKSTRILFEKETARSYYNDLQAMEFRTFPEADLNDRYNSIYAGAVIIDTLVAYSNSLLSLVDVEDITVDPSDAIDEGSEAGLLTLSDGKKDAISTVSKTIARIVSARYKRKKLEADIGKTCGAIDTLTTALIASLSQRVVIYERFTSDFNDFEQGSKTFESTVNQREKALQLLGKNRVDDWPIIVRHLKHAIRVIKSFREANRLLCEQNNANGIGRPKVDKAYVKKIKEAIQHIQ